MTTPNEDLILKLRGQAYTTCRPDQLCDQAAELLQSQAERIATLEDAELHTKQVERGLDKATAQLAEIGKTEPIARAMSDKTNTGYVYVKVLADKLQFGANLYSHPMPAESKDAERYRWLRDYLISPSTHFDDLIVSADKAETLDGVIDAAISKGAKQ